MEWKKISSISIKLVANLIYLTVVEEEGDTG